jgi:hypothetical protein
VNKEITFQRKVVLGSGTWDRWGFGVSYCHYSRAISIELIHWYFYIEVWPKGAGFEKAEQTE